MPTDHLKQHRAGGAVRIVLHSANEGVDEKVSYSVAITHNHRHTRPRAIYLSIYRRRK